MVLGTQHGTTADENKNTAVDSDASLVIVMLVVFLAGFGRFYPVASYSNHRIVLSCGMVLISKY